VKGKAVAMGYFAERSNVVDEMLDSNSAAKVRPTLQSLRPN